MQKLGFEESEIVEFKRSTSLWEEGAKTIVAFANTKGGKLFFGVEDDGSIVKNNKFNDSSLKRLSNQFQQSIDPNVYISMEIVRFLSETVIQITVDSSSSPLHTYRDSLYIRVGTTNQKCDKNELHKRLLRYSGNLNDWSAKICEHMSEDFLDLVAIKYFRDVIINRNLPNEKSIIYNNISDTDLLVSFNLILKKGSNFEFTNACVLLFGNKNDAIRLLGPQCRVQYRFSFSGNFNEYSQNSIAPDRGDWRPPFILSFEQIRNQIEKYNSFLVESDLFRNKQIKQYDMLTIRELMMNSFVHRDWLDRGFIQIEQTPNSLKFENPGKYKFENLLELVRFPNQSKFYRNCLLADFMFQCGLIEQEASGIKNKIIVKQVERGLPLPSYTLYDNWTIVNITSKIINLEFAKLLLNNTNIEILDLVLLDKIANQRVLVGKDIHKDDILRLKKKGYVETSGARFQHCFISKKVSMIARRTGEYTRKKGFNKNEQIQLVLKHIDHFGKIQVSDLDTLLPEITRDQKTNLLSRKMYRKLGLIKLVKPNGSNRGSWYYIKTDAT